MTEKRGGCSNGDEWQRGKMRQKGRPPQRRGCGREDDDDEDDDARPLLLAAAFISCLIEFAKVDANVLARPATSLSASDLASLSTFSFTSLVPSKQRSCQRMRTRTTEKCIPCCWRLVTLRCVWTANIWNQRLLAS